MTEGRGDGGGGYGHSGGCPCRVPAARAPPGVFEGGAAEMETAGESAEDLGDGGDALQRQDRHLHCHHGVKGSLVSKFTRKARC